MPKRQKVIIFLIVVFFIAVFSFLIFVLRQKNNDTIILNKDPWVNINLDVPNYTRPLSKEEIPNSAIKITAFTDSCQPKSFVAQKGKPVILVLLSEDSSQQVFEFEDKSLSLVKIIVDDKNPRGIIFRAPNNEGNFTFICGSSMKKNKTKGEMIVK